MSLLWFIAGFVLGVCGCSLAVRWFIRRNVTPILQELAQKKPDYGVKLLTYMYEQILDKRRFCGAATTVSISETIDVEGQRYRITMASEGVSQ